jgi:nitrous oxide reductase accessory protein NosL
MKRLLLIVAATLTLAACDSASTPTRPLSPASATHDGTLTDSVPDGNCRSGWSVANGRCA